MKHKALFVLGVFFASLLVNPSARAEESARLRIGILIASNEGNEYDLDNDAYRDQLIQLFSYTSYHQTGSFLKSLKKSKREKIKLSEGYELILTLQGTEKGRISVQAVIRKGKQQYVDTVLSILKPGVVFVGGPPVAVGSLIIILETGF